MDISTKIVVDTNIFFLSWYNPIGKYAEIIMYARNGGLELFSPDAVREEIMEIFRKRGFTKWEISDWLDDFPVNWIGKEFYQEYLVKTTTKKHSDKDVEALALMLNCGILATDSDFDRIKNRVDVDELLGRLKNGNEGKSG